MTTQSTKDEDDETLGFIAIFIVNYSVVDKIVFNLICGIFQFP